MMDGFDWQPHPDYARIRDAFVDIKGDVGAFETESAQAKEMLMHFIGVALPAVVLLNCRNGVTVDSHKIDAKLQQSRIKRGKAPLQDYGLVRLALRPAARSFVGDVSAAARDAARAHIVRGHFKVRSTGVFWWSHFVRGQGRTARSRGVVDTRYGVTA